MDKKVALITGASRGLGKSIAKKLAENSYNLILNYNSSEQEIKELQEELKKYDIKILTIKADISNEDEVKNMVNASINQFGKIDILINNAGIAIDTTVDDKTVENFKKILDVNLIGTFLVTKHVSKYMLKEKSGKIINISSTNGIDTNYPESMDYDASKAGVISLTHNFATLLAPYITVNCIAPGWINTEMNKDMDIEFRKNEENKIMLERFAEPEEIANLVEFLTSDKSSYINNTVIRIDGGKK